MTTWSRSVGRHNRRKIYICPMHHKNELGLHQSGLVLAFLYLCFVLLAFLFLLHKTQHNSTHRTPNNGVTNNHFLFIVGDSAEKIPRGYPHTIYERQNFFFFFLDIPRFVYLDIFPSTPHRQTPFFQTKGSSRSPSPALYSFKPSCHSSILSLRLFDRKMESGNRKQQPTQQHHKTLTKDTHK